MGQLTRPHVCVECDAGFTTAEALEAHRERQHATNSTTTTAQITTTTTIGNNNNRNGKRTAAGRHATTVKAHRS